MDISTIKSFVTENERLFVFNQSKEYKESLCKECFNIISNSSNIDDKINAICAIRILSREKSLEMQNNVCNNDLINILIKSTTLNEYAMQQDSKCVSLVTGDASIIEESLKALFNILKNFGDEFNTEKAKIILKGGLIQMQLFCGDFNEISHYIQIFVVKILFILTALHEDLRVFAMDKCDGFEAIQSVFKSHKDDLSKNVILDNVKIDNEILKFLFNLMFSIDEVEFDEDKDRKLRSLIRELMLLTLRVSDKLNSYSDSLLKEEFISNCINMLVTIPDQLIPIFINEDDQLMISSCQKPKLYQSEKAMQCFNIFIGSLDKVLTSLTNNGQRINNHSEINNIELVISMLHGLAKAAVSNKNIRKYLRLKILPYLKTEVYNLPQEGTTMRNKLCKLLQHANEKVTESAAFFIFVLCKKSVDRCVKYTGFGNFAGFLVRHSLLNQCSSISGKDPEDDQNDNESSSEDENDSETEEYNEVKDNINPVTGRVEKPSADKDDPTKSPFYGMSDEQKEYEVVQLMNQIDKLQREGFIKPAIFSEDGSVREAESVLEVVEKASQNKGKQ